MLRENKEKTSTHRAKFVTEQKLCFSCLPSDHTFRKCPESRKCNKPNCNSTDSVLFHGAEKIYPAKYSTNSPAGGKSFSHSANLEVETVRSTCATSVLRVKYLLPIVELKMSIITTRSNIIFLCDSACTRSWITTNHSTG